MRDCWALSGFVARVPPRDGRCRRHSALLFVLVLRPCILPIAPKTSCTNPYFVLSNAVFLYRGMFCHMGRVRLVMVCVFLLVIIFCEHLCVVVDLGVGGSFRPGYGVKSLCFY